MTEKQKELRRKLELWFNVHMTKDGWDNLFRLFSGRSPDEVKDWGLLVTREHTPEWFREIIDEAERYDKYCQEVYEEKPLKPLTVGDPFAVSAPLPTNNQDWFTVFQATAALSNTSNSTTSINATIDGSTWSWEHLAL